MTVFILSLLSASGAFAQKITTEFDQAADFTTYKTFAIREVKLTSTNPVLNSDLIKKRIEAEIERALKAMGLTLVAGPADLDLWCQFGSDSREDVDVVRGGGRGTGPSVVRTPTTEGTLVIDLRNPATRALIWRGVATEQQREAVRLQGRLENMVKKSIAKYPRKK